jgi:hypothetical protein
VPSSARATRSRRCSPTGPPPWRTGRSSARSSRRAACAGAYPTVLTRIREIAAVLWGEDPSPAAAERGAALRQRLPRRLRRSRLPPPTISPSPRSTSTSTRTRSPGCSTASGRRSSSPTRRTVSRGSAGSAIGSAATSASTTSATRTRTARSASRRSARVWRPAPPRIASRSGPVSGSTTWRRRCSPRKHRPPQGRRLLDLQPGHEALRPRCGAAHRGPRGGLPQLPPALPHVRPVSRDAGRALLGGHLRLRRQPSAETLLAELPRVCPTALISIPLRWVQIRDRVLEGTGGTEEAFRDTVGDRLRWGLSAAGYLDPRVFRFFQRHGVALCSGFA